jgi:hypothetical protein
VPLWFVSAAEPASPIFQLQTASGEPASGPLLALTENWGVHLGGAKEVRAEGGDVVALRRAGVVMPAIPAKNFVLFSNGDVLPVRRVRLADERLVLVPHLGDGKEIRVSPSRVAVIWLRSPDAENHPDHLRRELAAGQRPRDRVLLRNGDSLDGTLTGMDEKSVRLDIDKKSIDVRLDRIAALALNTELASKRQPKAPYARLVLANGGRLSLASATSDGKMLTGKTLLGAVIQVKLEDVIALTIHQGRAIYLSDLKPSKIEQTPYLDVASPPMRDASVKGRDLRLGGGFYDKGLGMHSACRMTYDLSGAYKRFEALVGLDDATGREGSARVQVLVDGKPRKLDLEGDLTHRNGPLAIRVDVTGAKQLTLVVDFSSRGDVQADLNWVDARLIRN